MARFSVSFDPTTDNVDSVCEYVERLFSLFAVTQTAVATVVTPSPAAALAAAAAPVPPAPAANPGVQQALDRDTSGLPWDKRIHSDPATKTDKGVWRKKRNVDAALVAQVTAELLAGAGVTPTPPAAPPAAVTPPAPVAPPAPPAPVVPPAPVAPPAPPAPVPSAYEQLVRFLAANTYGAANPTGRLTDDWVRQSLEAYSVPGGLIQNCADWPAENLQTILAGIKTALGQ